MHPILAYVPPLCVSSQFPSEEKTDDAEQHGFFEKNRSKELHAVILDDDGMPNVITKMKETHCDDILITDRGTQFGYNNLVSHGILSFYSYHNI